MSGQEIMLTPGDFKLKHRFPLITPAQLQEALQIVNAQFSGVYTLWSLLSPAECRAKRELCINYLVAWKLADMYPSSVTEVSGMGPLPLTSKRAGPVNLTYRNMVRQSGSGLLELLTTNEFGLQALAMIQSAPENYLLETAHACGVPYII